VIGAASLFARVWPGRVVEENNLHVHISALRKVLGARHSHGAWPWLPNHAGCGGHGSTLATASTEGSQCKFNEFYVPRRCPAHAPALGS
jgi:hypothetical protein